MSTITYDQRLTEFKFRQHKAYSNRYIPDDDYEKLSIVYDIPSDELKAIACAIVQSNRHSAFELLTGQHNDVSSIRAAKVGFLGDSITAYRESYANIIKEAFRCCPGIEFYDFSVSGAKSSDLFTYLHPFIWEKNLSLVHIMIGTNDFRRTADGSHDFHTSPDEFRKNISYIVSRYATEGIPVILTTIPPFSENKLKGNFESYRILYTEQDRNNYNMLLYEIALEFGVIFNNMEPYYRKYSPDAITLDDGLHLNAAGHKLIAERVFYYITEVLCS